MSARRLRRVLTGAPPTPRSRRPTRLPRLDRTAAGTSPDGPGPDAVAGLAERVAALARAGLGPVRIWEVVAEHEPAWQDLATGVLRTLRLGGSVAEALRPTLPAFALACQVSDVAGASLADVLDGLAATLRSDADADRERDAALAGPRATAALLSWLPVGGILLGLAAGTDPAAVLVSGPAGRGCLLVGTALWWAGRRWTSALVRRAAAVDDG